MAIGTFSEVVYQTVPWLVSPDDDEFVDDEVCLAQYELQGDLGKTDAQVEDPNEYNSRETLLVGLYTSLNIICAQVLENTSGTTGSGGDGEKTLTKAKADVVESEWKAKTEKDVGLHATADKIEIKLRSRICRLARSMSLSLQLCIDPNREVDPVDVGVVPFDLGCGFTPCDC